MAEPPIVMLSKFHSSLYTIGMQQYLLESSFPRNALQPLVVRGFLKEFDIEFFALGLRWHRGGGHDDGRGWGRKSPWTRRLEKERWKERVEERNEGKGECIISKFGTRNPPSLTSSFHAGDCELSRGLSSWSLPSDTTELRRRIITFYADFNTRLRRFPLPIVPCPVAAVRPRLPVTAVRIVDSTISSARSPLNDGESSFSFITSSFLFSFLSLFLPHRTPVIGHAISPTIDRIFLVETVQDLTR